MDWDDDVPNMVMFLQPESRRHRGVIIRTVGFLVELLPHLQARRLESVDRVRVLISDLIELAQEFSAQPANRANEDNDNDAMDSDSDSESDSNDDDDNDDPSDHA